MKKINNILKYLMAFILCLTMLSCNKKPNKTTLNSKQNIMAEGEFEDGSELVVLPIKEITNKQKELIAEKEICFDNNFISYDISIQKDNVKLQPNGNVKITIDKPFTSKNGYSVFHFKSETEMEVLSTTIENNKLSFETSSFSVFIIGENMPEEYSYTITYNLDGGRFEDGTIAIEAYSNESVFPIALPTPIKDNYNFAGWQNAYNVKMNEITKKMRGDLLLTALWQEPAYTRNNNSVIFGNYPQSQIVDEEIIKKLNAATGVNKYADLTDVEIEGWTYFDYLKKGEIAKNMAYYDITIDGDTYRGVYIKEYTQKLGCLTDRDDSYNYQNDYGYTKGNVYWFKYEPIKWVILKEDKENNKAMIMAELALDVKPFQDLVKQDNRMFYNGSLNAPEDTMSYNWEYSYIRKWLNETFYNNAFTELQKEIIQTVKIDNSAYNDTVYTCKNTRGIMEADFASEYINPDTEDKIFILSLQEFMTLPRFEKNSSNNDNFVGYADYYKAMGGKLNSSVSKGTWYYETGACYMFRTPRSNAECWIYDYGNSLGDKHYYQYSYMCTYGQNYGIVPVLWIEL